MRGWRATGSASPPTTPFRMWDMPIPPQGPPPSGCDRLGDRRGPAAAELRAAGSRHASQDESVRGGAERRAPVPGDSAVQFGGVGADVRTGGRGRAAVSLGHGRGLAVSPAYEMWCRTALRMAQSPALSMRVGRA